jgi:hypothetical protein
METAIRSFKYAIQLEPNFPDAFNNLGNALREVSDPPPPLSFSEPRLQIGNLDEAIQCYRSSLRLKPDHPHAYNNLGVSSPPPQSVLTSSSSRRECDEGQRLDPGGDPLLRHLRPIDAKVCSSSQQFGICPQGAREAGPSSGALQGGHQHQPSLPRCSLEHGQHLQGHGPHRGSCGMLPTSH